MDAVRAALDTAITAYATKFRLSLAAFPNDALCGQAPAGPADLRVPPLSLQTDAPAPLQAQAGLVNASVQRISSFASGPDLVAGGTPTAAALRQLGALAQPDATRETFVLLITDGLPNCSATNPNTCTNPTACRCTVTSCGTTPAAPLCTLGCLADAETLAAIAALRNQQLRTIVLAVGPDAFSDVFTALATAGGGPPRACTTDDDCGRDDFCRLPEGRCQLPYFHGSSEAQLRKQLLRIFDRTQ